MLIKRQNFKPLVAQRAKESGKDRSRSGQFQKSNVYAWKAGQSGNPSGRPKYKTVREAMRRKLAEVDSSDPYRRTYAEQIAEHMVRLAAGYYGTASASIMAAREIADRTEGKPRRALELPMIEDAAQVLASLLGCSVDELPPPED